MRGTVITPIILIAVGMQMISDDFAILRAKFRPRGAVGGEKI